MNNAPLRNNDNSYILLAFINAFNFEQHCESLHREREREKYLHIVQICVCIKFQLHGEKDNDY